MDKAEAVCEQIRNMGQEAIPVQADIADRDAVNKMVATVTEELGTIELLVNNAGDVGDMTFEELTPEHWDRIIAINLTGPFNVLWAVKPGMIERQFGRIVNVSSIAALAVRPNQLPYAAAKAGVISLTKSCCGPLAQHNIRINSVAPGAIATDMLGEVSTEMAEQLRATTPLGRFGEPEEMADVIAFLLERRFELYDGCDCDCKWWQDSHTIVRKARKERESGEAWKGGRFTVILTNSRTVSPTSKSNAMNVCLRSTRNVSL